MDSRDSDPHLASAEGSRDHVVNVFLRAWLSIQSSLTVDEVKRRLESLGRPARDAILRAGGLEAFVAESPEVEIRGARLVPIPVSGPGTSSRQSILNHMDAFTPAELTALNEQLVNVRLEPKSGDVVSALQKRGQLAELQRKCQEKRIALENRKRELAKIDKSVPPTEHELKTLEELINRRDELRLQVIERKKILQKERKLREDMAKIDARIEDTEDQVERLKLKMTMVQEHLVGLREDLFFESKQHEALVEQLLKQHSEDSDRVVRILDIIAKEKFNHSRTVLGLHISTVTELIRAKDSSASEKDQKAIDELQQQLTEYETKLREITQAEERFDQRQANFVQVSQLPVVRIRDLIRPQGDDRRSVIFPSLVKDVFQEELETRGDDVEQKEPAQVGTNSTENCQICLYDLHAEASETLSCSHRFHSSCLREMRSFGHSSCPLCRCYAPSPTEFPSLNG